MSDAREIARTAVANLTPDEKLEMISIIWDDLSTTPENIPFPDWQLAELERREAELEKNPDSALSWDDVLRQIRAKYPS
jgi:putative addiction module component (TIGR02574 family)